MNFEWCGLINMLVSFVGGLFGGWLVIHINSKNTKQIQKAGDNANMQQRA